MPNSLLQRKLLADLWSRGSGVFQQESDLLIVTYKGSVSEKEIFDVGNLSTVVVQIKHEINADTKAGPVLRPVGLPYLALLMELGNESPYPQTNAQIQVTPRLAASDGVFKDLQKSATEQPEAYRALNQEEESRTRNLAQKTESQETVEDAQAATGDYNRFSISVRGASPTVYGALRDANIVEQFANLLRVTMPPPTAA